MPAARKPHRQTQAGPYYTAESPKCPRRQRTQRTITYVPPPPGHELIREALKERLEKARNPQTSELSGQPLLSEGGLVSSDCAANPLDLNQSCKQEANPVIHRLPPCVPAPQEEPVEPLGTLPPTNRTQSVFNRWNALLPRLMSPYLKYVRETKARRASFPTGEIETECQTSSCSRHTHKILCLFPCDHEYLSVIWCECQGIAEVLVSHGLFPGTPTRPNIAFSIMLLKLYHSIFLRTADAVNSFAASYNDFYIWRGYRTTNMQGETSIDPYRRTLGLAFLWFSNLLDKIEKKAAAALAQAEIHLNLYRRAAELTLPSPQRNYLQAPRLLRERCAACFGGNSFGRSLREGGDIHVAVDGNFNHRHLRSVRNCPAFYEPEFIISKAEVDNAGHRLDEKRKRPKPAKKRLCPDEAIEKCKASHTSGSGSNAKTDMKRFDAGGLMGLVCRHDVPLFAANIDTAGEGQKYAVALIEHLMNLLPSNATVTVLYDVGCVLDRTLDLHHVIDDNTLSRLQFGTSALHAYAHQWACQLVYNPRMQEGFGLTDGEGVERLWSLMRNLVIVTRTCSGGQRIHLIDRQLGHIGNQIRNDLGRWIRRKLEKYVKPQQKKAEKELAKLGFSSKEIQEQWALQRDAQLSIRRYTSNEVREELEKAISLEGELDKVVSSLQLAEKKMKGKEDEPDLETSALHVNLTIIRNTYTQRCRQVYTSIGIESKFPRLSSLCPDFLTKLLTAYDLKVTIRGKVTASRFEWDRIDQASRGRDQPIGTRAHQSTRQAISRRKPALLNLIRKYNALCKELREEYNPGWNVPLPEPVPEDLDGMRKNSDELMQEVWISDSTPPQWIADKNMRNAIQHFLKSLRCAEEMERLKCEANNIVRWLGREYAVVQLLITLGARQPNGLDLMPLLYERRAQLLDMKSRWHMPGLVSETALDSEVLAAQNIVKAYVGSTTQPVDDTELCPRFEVVTCFSEKEHSKDSGNAFEDDEDDPFPPSDKFEEEADTFQHHSGVVDQTTVLKEMVSEIILCSESSQADEVISTSSDSSGLVIYKWTFSQIQQEQTADDLFESLAMANIEVAGIPDDREDNLDRYIALGLNRFVEFKEDTIRRLRDPDELLDDLSINGLAQVLQHKLTKYPPTSTLASQCALFSTFHLVMFRYTLNEEQLWSHSKSLQYWDKPTWIIPIHRAGGIGHWVMCIVSFRHNEIYLFDSLAGRNWADDVEDIVSMISCLQGVAIKNGKNLFVDQTWTARPALLLPRQTAGVTCGLWVLASITSALCGYTGPGLTEPSIENFRDLMIRYILTLPTK